MVLDRGERCDVLVERRQATDKKLMLGMKPRERSSRSRGNGAVAAQEGAALRADPVAAHSFQFLSSSWFVLHQFTMLLSMMIIVVVVVVVVTTISSSSRNSNSGVWGERVVTFRRAARARL
jgi:hypothetical protein